jgi:hypothetical protein
VGRLTQRDAARVYREGLRCALGQFMASDTARLMALGSKVLD